MTPKLLLGPLTPACPDLDMSQAHYHTVSTRSPNSMVPSDLLMDIPSSNSLLTLQFDISPVKVHTEDHYSGDHYPISVSLHPSQDHDTLDENNNHSRLPSLQEGKKEDWMKAAKP